VDNGAMAKAQVPSVARKVAPTASRAPAPGPLQRSPGRPLDAVVRTAMESRFQQDFSGVRVHADTAAAASASTLFADAYTFGNDVVFGAGRYAPASADGRRLLARELMHVVQQRRGLAASAAALEREARAAERGRDGSLAAAGPRWTSAAVPAPSLQFQDNRAAMQARLQQVRARLAELNARYQRLSDAFTTSAVDERLRESTARATERLHAQVRSESAAPHLWGGTFAGARIRRAVTAAVSGTTATLTANIQIAYLALADADARRQAAIDIPRIATAIQDVWQVDITSGEYAGLRVQLVPRITHVSRSAPPPEDAFLIQVRAPDKEPSSGDSVHGLISLAPVHLQGARVVVVAHELAHLFGFLDAYSTMTLRGKRNKTITQRGVGRVDPRNRPDLLGMIDPVHLERWRREGSVTAEQFARQSAPVHVWEEDAAIVLRTLGVAPPARPRPTPDSEDFDPQVELDRIRSAGEARLAGIRRRQARAENSIESVEIAEQIIQLEREERELTARLGASAP
jgi:Domain of unknown function (DUF4157)